MAGPQLAAAGEQGASGVRYLQRRRGYRWRWGSSLEAGFQTSGMEDTGRRRGVGRFGGCCGLHGVEVWGQKW